MQWMSKLETVRARSICKGLRQIIPVMAAISQKWHQHMLESARRRLCVRRQGTNEVHGAAVGKIREEWTNTQNRTFLFHLFVCFEGKNPIRCSFPQLFLRALFDYDPDADPAVPCKDAAIGFKRGDVLQVVSTEDDTWWQACHLRDGSTRGGLIPSRQLHERWCRHI